MKQTQWFTACTVAQTKVALADSGAVEAHGLWMVAEDVDAAADFQVPEQEQIQLLAGTDELFLLRRNAADNFAQEDRGRKLLRATLALQADLTDHPIVDRGRIIGLWQYDPGTV